MHFFLFFFCMCLFLYDWNTFFSTFVCYHMWFENAIVTFCSSCVCVEFEQQKLYKTKKIEKLNVSYHRIVMRQTVWVDVFCHSLHDTVLLLLLNAMHTQTQHRANITFQLQRRYTLLRIETTHTHKRSVNVRQSVQLCILFYSHNWCECVSTAARIAVYTQSDAATELFSLPYQCCIYGVI